MPGRESPHGRGAREAQRSHGAGSLLVQDRDGEGDAPHVRTGHRAAEVTSPECGPQKVSSQQTPSGQSGAALAGHPGHRLGTTALCGGRE